MKITIHVLAFVLTLVAYGNCFGQSEASVSGSFQDSSSSDQIIADLRHPQVPKQIADAVFRRLSTEIGQDLQGFNPTAISNSSGLENFGAPVAASADGLSNGSFWASTPVTEISDEAFADFDIDIYQLIGGIDKKFGDWYAGSTMTYAYTEIEIGRGNVSTGQTIGLTPYAAYVINKYFFVTGLLGWTYTHTNRNPVGGFVRGDTDTHNYTAELDFNGLKVIDNWIFKGRIGSRYSHRHVDFEINSANRGVDDSSDTLEWIADVETGYLFDNRLMTYIGLQYDYTDNEDLEGDGILYFRGGAEYPISQALTVGVKFSSELIDEDIDIFTGLFDIRLNF